MSTTVTRNQVTSIKNLRTLELFPVHVVGFDERGARVIHNPNREGSFEWAPVNSSGEVIEVDYDDDCDWIEVT